MSKIMIEIGENMKSSLLMDLLRHIHQMAKQPHHISDFRTCNGQVNKLPHKSAIGMNSCK